MFGVRGEECNINMYGRTCTYKLTVPKRDICRFLERDMQMRDMPKEYHKISPHGMDAHSGRVTFFNETVYGFYQGDEELDHRHASIRRDRLHLRNPPLAQPDPVEMAYVTPDLMQDTVRGVLGSHPRAGQYTTSFMSVFENAHDTDTTGQLMKVYLRSLIHIMYSQPTLNSERKVAAIAGIATGCPRSCKPGQLTRIQQEYNRLVDPTNSNPVRAELLSAVEEFKNDILTTMASEHHSQSVHCFSLAQITWGDELGLSKEVGLRDEFGPMYGTGFVTPSNKQLFINTYLSKYNELLEVVYNHFMEKAQDDPSWLGSCHDSLVAALQSRGCTPTEVEEWIDDSLMPVLSEEDGGDGYTCTITKEAVKQMLIHYEVLYG
jgi:hypothetical protein